MGIGSLFHGWSVGLENRGRPRVGSKFENSLRSDTRIGSGKIHLIDMHLSARRHSRTVDAPVNQRSQGKKVFSVFLGHGPVNARRVGGGVPKHAESAFK